MEGRLVSLDLRTGKPELRGGVRKQRDHGVREAGVKGLCPPLIVWPCTECLTLVA